MAALDTYGPFIFGAEHKRETDRIDPTEISPVNSEHSGSSTSRGTIGVRPCRPWRAGSGCGPVWGQRRYQACSRWCHKRKARPRGEDSRSQL